MNRYERAFLRVVLGWGFKPTTDGVELWTPISLDHLPQVLSTFKIDWETASMLDVADLIATTLGPVRDKNIFVYLP